MKQKEKEKIKEKYRNASDEKRQQMIRKAIHQLGDREEFWTYVTCNIDEIMEKIKNLKEKI